MFLLIAPINGFGSSEFSDPWDKWMKRQAAINWSVIQRAQKPKDAGINSEEFQELVIEQNGDVLTVHIFGTHYFPCGDNSMDKLNRDFRKLKKKIQDGEVTVKEIICKFDRVKFMNSEGLAVIISLHRILEKQGGKLELSGVNLQLKEVLKITKLNTLFKVV